MSTLPRRPCGRLSAAKEAAYCAQVSDFCETIKVIRETLDFKVSSRGWCYILEEKIGLLKGDFDRAQDLINDCRKNGLLSLDICAEDETRSTLHLPVTDDDTPVQYARGIVNRIQWAHLLYELFCIWDDLPVVRGDGGREDRPEEPVRRQSAWISSVSVWHRGTRRS